MKRDGAFTVTLQDLATIKTLSEHSNIVLWTNRVSDEFAFQAISVGVRGILRRSLSIELLNEALLKINKGEGWIETELSKRMLETKRVFLTEREGKLLNGVCQGLKNKAIAEIMGIKEGTVKFNLTHLFRKLGVKNRQQLAMHGLTSLLPSSVQEELSLPHPGIRDIPTRKKK